MPAVYGSRLTTFEDAEKESEYGYVRKVRTTYFRLNLGFSVLPQIWCVLVVLDPGFCFDWIGCVHFRIDLLSFGVNFLANYPSVSFPIVELKCFFFFFNCVIHSSHWPLRDLIMRLTSGVASCRVNPTSKSWFRNWKNKRGKNL